MRTKRPVFVYQIQAEGTLDQVVQARVEGKADVQDLLMGCYRMKKPHSGERGHAAYSALTAAMIRAVCTLVNFHAFAHLLINFMLSILINFFVYSRR